MTVLIPLHAAIDRTVSGAKAANLARLMDLGFPVPAGVVVPATAFTANAAEGAPEALPPSLLEELYERSRVCDRALVRLGPPGPEP